MIQLISPHCQPKSCAPANNGFYTQHFTVPDGESEIQLTGFQSQNPNTFMVFDNGVLLTQVTGTPQDVTCLLYTSDAADE